MLILTEHLMAKFVQDQQNEKVESLVFLKLTLERVVYQVPL